MNVVGTNPGISSIITFNINGCTGKRQRFPRRHTGGQQVHEKMLNITKYQRNANQNYNGVSPLAGQNGHQKNLPTESAGEGVKKRETSYTVGGKLFLSQKILSWKFY